MFNRFNKFFGIFILLFTLIIIIPTSFALNETDIHAYDSNGAEIADEVMSISDDDRNPLGVDYYFDSSSNETGDGSIENPYNELTLAKIKSSSTIHLANGEYDLKSGKTLSKVTIIGEDPEKTIIRYTGSSGSGVFKVGLDNYLILQNVTLIGFNLDLAAGNIQATNTIFKDAVAPSQESGSTNLVNSAVNSFGGVIYAYASSDYGTTYTPTVILENCSFINNSAEYGGAILIQQGTLDIVNSAFINNTAYNYGGAIVGDVDSSVRVKNTKFINDRSLNDAGGAIYLFKSFLSASNVTVINCSSTFGSVVTALDSTTAMAYLNAINNTAKYEGGAVYQMYGGISITDSNFINNSARNGGAIYVDDVSIFNLAYNNFEDNKASMMAGAAYLLLVGNSTIKNNNYTRNKAAFYDDLYQTNKINMFIGNGNYTLIFSNDTYVGQLPSNYSSLSQGYVTSVKDQQSGGNCWAFAGIAVLESAILKASGLNLDLSEEHMKNIMEIYSDYGWLMETNQGGYTQMEIAYLTSWLGPVFDSIEEYDDYSTLSPVLDSFTHIQNIIFLSRSNYLDNDAIKRAIINYGAVQSGIYYDSSYFSTIKNSYYYYGSGYANHGVAIVGWDDNYSKDNFIYKPNGDGAWIVKNSWNDDWGDNGYFYVSYYDTRLAEVGVIGDMYAIVFNDSERYDKNYQYDLIGETDYYISSNNTIWVENIFESTDNELLAAVSTLFRKTTDYELFIYLNDELTHVQNGTCYPGYTTIKLSEHIPISTGDKFKIVFKLTCDENVEFAISEKIKATKLTYAPGISFFSKDGINWIDLFDYEDQNDFDEGHTYDSQVACIKAFTILYELQPSIKLNISNIYNKFDITAVIQDQYGNLIRSGEVIFHIGNEDYNAKIENSIAHLTHIFNDTGSCDIAVVYKNGQVNATVNITRINIDLDSTIAVDKNNVLISFISPLNVTTAINVLINNQSEKINLINGKANLTLNDLDFGYYEVISNVDDEVYASELNSGFNITISKTTLIASDLITYYSFNNPYSVILKDIYGNPVVNRQISFIADGKSFVATSDENGIASTIINMDSLTKNYKINVIFYGDENYFASNTTVNGNVKSTVNFLSSNYLVNSEYGAILLDNKGNPLPRTQVNVIIDNNDNWIITDSNGKISLNLNLKAGSHNVFIKNPETGEIAYQTINVVSRIMENKNINTFYLSGDVYNIRVYDDNGNPVGAGNVVNIVVNKKTYDIKTDSKGYASFKLNQLKAGSYTITAKYAGAKVSNKVVIKPLLTAKNISKKKAKTIKFSAKLVNSKGKPDKGKKITFKIKNKVYKAKTNSNGIAKISIKNLKVGKYTITTKYGKSTIKNTIKIKK